MCVCVCGCVCGMGAREASVWVIGWLGWRVGDRGGWGEVGNVGECNWRGGVDQRIEKQPRGGESNRQSQRKVNRFWWKGGRRCEGVSWSCAMKAWVHRKDLGSDLGQINEQPGMTSSSLRSQRQCAMQRPDARNGPAAQWWGVNIPFWLPVRGKVGRIEQKRIWRGGEIEM